MPSLAHFLRRRAQLLEVVKTPVLLMAGGEVPRNYPANVSPYRADSNFLFLFDRPEPRSAALLDPADGSVTLFLPRRTADDALWHGAVPSFDEMREHHGVDRVLPVEELATQARRLAGDRPLRSLAVVDPEATALARSVTGEDLVFRDSARIGDPALVQAIGALRARKAPEEIEEMRKTAAVTVEAHTAAMAHTRVGGHEQELAGIVTGVFARHGCVPAYNNILSVRGEVLHNNHHGNELRAGDVVLLDAGAESRTGFCSDVTRCWPVEGHFSTAAAAIYDIVLAAEKAAIDSVRPGMRYRDIHMQAAVVIAAGLADLGLLRGNPTNLVEAGAHALFFPHGVGHFIGLDVHDMEAFGDAIAYPEGRQRSEQFGTAWLRLDVDLEPGMTFTIEPGVYFVPAILESPDFRSRFADQVVWARAEEFLRMNGGRGFGGIRIEDDVLCQEDGTEVLTRAMPKERGEIEALVGSAL